MAVKTDKQLQDALNDCIDRLLQGQTVQECLMHYPNLANDLAPLLQVASTTLHTAARLRSTPEMRGRILAQVLARSQPRRQGRGWLSQALRPWFLAPAAAVLFLGAFWGVSSASANSTPGDPLYPVKTIRERVAIAITRSPEGKARLAATLARQRAEEAETLVARGKDGEALEGLLLQMAAYARQAADYWASIPEEGFEEFEEGGLGAPRAKEGASSQQKPKHPATQPPRITPAAQGEPLPSANYAIPLPPGLARKEAVRLEVWRVLIERVQAQEAHWQEVLRRAPPQARPGLEQAHLKWRQRVQEALQVLDRPVLPPAERKGPHRPIRPKQP
ncbi:MAG: DUF5667 domain-containing protein [Dehalococcoidia bacterium]